ncbi:MAG: sigma-54-dependent Fis family transcriptional regulator [Deltaproteobacteria bacterium]|nr:sigma-54-dependent Fis family transcriptional regulator [Deltaproteobacteria bacterium]
MGVILIIDDDYQIRESFEKLLTEEGHEVLTAASGETGLDVLHSVMPDLVLLDLRLPGMSGLETFLALREIESKLPVIIMTAFGTTETAIEATKLGAFDYILKPFDIPDILKLITQALEASRFMRSHVEIDILPKTPSSEVIIGQSKPMQEIYKAIGRVAPTEATVLVRGESGTGKELVARAIYQHSQRAGKPFLVINCVAIPETLLESELFGYEKGAFTGAVSRRMGRIEQANGGTIFLDEIGDMPFSIQAKILRLLQEKSIERLGGREPIPVDVRIIAATNRDLEAGLAEGRFREDLYYRLKVVTIWLPPLRDRHQDISRLADYFLDRFAQSMDIDNPGLTDEARGILKNYHWPGNVRELANTIQKALIFSRGYPIRPEDISQVIQGEPVVRDEGPPTDGSIRQWARKALMNEPGMDKFDHLIDQVASALISEALDITGGNRSRAAKILGVSRPTLQSKIEKYGITMETSVKSEGD